MKGKLERVPQRIGASWRYVKILEPIKEYGWHRHEEYEIAIHRHFTGSCFIGTYHSEVTHNHMVLVGSGLPHAIYSNDTEDSKPCETHVVWFRKQWIDRLIDQCNELKPLRILLNDASRGVQFSPITAEKVVASLSDFQESSSAMRLSLLFEIFALMLEDTEAVRLINLPTHTDEVSHGRSKLNLEKIDQYLLENYHQTMSAHDLAEHLFLSESSLRRIFSQHFKESFSQRLKKIRLNVACDMLTNTSLPISIIIEKVGYDNQANFNRQFKAYTRTTPRGYREATTRIR